MVRRTPSPGSRRRELPDFVVLGAAKAGTTSLASLLGRHPEIYLPELPEPGWLAWDGGAPRRWPTDVPADVPIRRREAYAALFAAAPVGALAGDVSPIYLESAVAPRRIAAELPDAVLAATLRDPAERAWSGYWMHRQAGLERRPPRDAFGAEEHRIQAGFYARNLEPFGPDVVVLIFEEWTDDLAALGPLAARLGIDPAGFGRSPPSVNRGGLPRSPLIAATLASPRARALGRRLPRPLADAARALKARALAPVPPLPDALRARLDALYAPDVRALADRLGRLPVGWLKSGPSGL